MITIIGNKLNSANKKVLDRMNKGDFEFIKRETQLQLEHGAEFIELNASCLLHNEIAFLKAAVPRMEKVGAKVMVISENAEALKEAISIAQREVIAGAIEFDREKIDYLINIVKDKKVRYIALIREKDSHQKYSPEKSLLIAQQYIDYLLDRGMNRQNILLDPMVRALEQDCSNGKIFLNTLELFKIDFPHVKTIANISHFSEGLPRRYLIASYFVSLAMAKGLDYIVTNVMDERINESINTTLSIIGKDKNLKTYLKYCRDHKETDSKGSKDGGSKNKRDID